MSLFKSAAHIPPKEKDASLPEKLEVNLVDIGEPLAKIVRANNDKAVQDYWNAQKGSKKKS